MTPCGNICFANDHNKPQGVDAVQLRMYAAARQGLFCALLLCAELGWAGLGWASVVKGDRDG